MATILLVFVGGICFVQGYNAYNCEKQTKVFNKRNLPLKDVKAYNQFCGKLIYGFGIVAVLTLALVPLIPVVGSLLSTILILVEAYFLTKIYSKNEIKFFSRM